MPDEHKPPVKADPAGNGSSAPTNSQDANASDGGYRVQLPSFEGPLDLLLHLIQQHELDIFDIPIAFITKKYVEYITLMEAINIDVASEYLVMAATLTHIKSKMLLPSAPDDEEAEEELELDPRAELVRRLLEYQKYKNAAEALSDRSILGRDVFTRGAPAPSVEGPAPLAPVGLFKLLDAFQAVLQRSKQIADHQIDVDRFSISDRINQLSDILKVKKKVSFEELFEDSQTRPELIVTFLALLEMTRLRLIRLAQSAPLEPILIELAVDDSFGSDEVDELSRSTASAEGGADDSFAGESVVGSNGEEPFAGESAAGGSSDDSVAGEAAAEEGSVGEAISGESSHGDAGVEAGGVDESSGSQARVDLDAVDESSTDDGQGVFDGEDASSANSESHQKSETTESD